MASICKLDHKGEFRTSHQIFFNCGIFHDSVNIKVYLKTLEELKQRATTAQLFGSLGCVLTTRCRCLGDEDISHVPRGDDQRRDQTAGGGAPGGAREGRDGHQRRRGARLRPADRGAPPEAQRRPQDGEDEGEGNVCVLGLNRGTGGLRVVQPVWFSAILTPRFLTLSSVFVSGRPNTRRTN